MLTVITSPLAHAVFLAWLAAAAIDIGKLVVTGQTRGWLALKDFDWNLATFRWATGVVSGLAVQYGSPTVTGLLKLAGLV